MSLQRILLLIVSIIILIGVTWFGIKWFAPFEARLEPGVIERDISEKHGGNTVTDTISKVSIPSFQVDTVATGLDTPWSIVFTSPERMLVTERPGRLRVIEQGRLLDKPLHVFSEVSEIGEEGLMSLALHPQYSENRFVYVSLAYQVADAMWVKVLRLKDEGNRLGDSFTIIDRIPADRYHAGSRIAFGPDGKLYVSTGDATDKKLAQDLNSLAGKILRLHDDGTIPHDNPFGNAVWSYGHRNPQGLAWHPETNNLYASEHGPSVFDGPAGGDEVNLIEKSKNYGWPLVSHEKHYDGTERPLIIFTPAEAPASLLAYSGRQYANWRGNLFFGALRGEGLVRLELDPHNPRKVLVAEKLEGIRVGRIREVMEGPDGAVYFATSNRDGRGKPAPEDDRIFRLSLKR
jgi:glucose/arabinose dehydrogenase